MLTEADLAVPLPSRVAAFVEERGLGDVVGHVNLTGGLINVTRRVTTTSGFSFIVKQGASALPDIYRREAEGLAALGAGGARVPEVYAVEDDFIALEDLGSPPSEFDWEDFGRRIGQLHLVHSDRFGFATDNYIGSLPQANPWTEDGYEFYARHRLHAFLAVPTLRAHTPPEIIAGVERIADRIRDLVPPQPASLLHGDLWLLIGAAGEVVGNVMLDRDGVPALIDPAAHFGWAESELGLTQLWGKDIPRVFWDAYTEVNPLEDGWEERLRLFHLHDGLGIMAHFGDSELARDHAIPQLAGIVERFG